MLLIEVQLKTQMPRIMKSTYPWHSCLFVSRLLLDLCGFAASRAESLRLSVKPTTLMAARPPRRSLYFPNSYGKPRRQSRKSNLLVTQRQAKAYRTATLVWRSALDRQGRLV